MNSWRFILLCGILIFSSSACMTNSFKKNIPEHIGKLVAAEHFLSTAKNFQFNRGGFNGWIAEEAIFQEQSYEGAELYYIGRYAGTKENLLDIAIPDINYEEELLPNHQLDKYDVKTYDMVYSFSSWLDYIEKIYEIPRKRPTWKGRRRADIPRPSNALTYMDAHCYRIINPERTRSYDIIFIVSKKTDFVFTKQPDLLAKEMKALSTYNTRTDQDASLQTYRFATGIEPLLEYAGQISGFSLLQLVEKRTIGGRSLWALLHHYYERRIRDTYIFILTGDNVKLIIQTFYHPDTQIEEIEKDLRKILNSIIIRP